MKQTNMVRLVIADSVFQAHGADAAGHVLFYKRLTQPKVLGFFAALPPRVVTVQASGVPRIGSQRGAVGARGKRATVAAHSAAALVPALGCVDNLYVTAQLAMH